MYNMVPNIILNSDSIVAGSAPVMCPPARNAAENELDDDCSMDMDEHLDYPDQEPLSFPMLAGVL
jgi:hypothetical protein